MIFSVTETLTFKRCRRLWALQSENMEGIQPIRPNVALLIGSLMHASLEGWTNQRMAQEDPELATADDEEPFLVEAQKIVETYKKQYKDAIGANPSATELEPLLDGMALAQDMYTNYIAHYKKPVPKGWTLINLEQRTITDIPGTEHWECGEGHLYPSFQPPGINLRQPDDEMICKGDGTTIKWGPHQIRGTMDGLLERKKNGLFYALERKTYAIHPRPDTIALEEQMRTYCWILRQLFGEKAGGILYDGMWKRDGSNKKHKPEDLFYRSVFERTQHDLDECGEQLAEVVMDMASLRTLPVDHPKLYHNRRWEGCNLCGMQKLCAAISRGEDIDFIRSTEYTRREDPNLSWLEAAESN